MVRQRPAKPPFLGSNPSATYFQIWGKVLLFIVATPIGNLEEISQRALKTLNEVDAILCEDTRRSSILLKSYEIQKPLISYHKFKEKASLAPLLEDLKNGKNLALISDAGTPCINDPGQILVDACIENKIPVTAIAGPCSIIQALVLSGFDTKRFQFIGFLPKKPDTILKQALNYPGLTVAFESPERIIHTLSLLPQDCSVAVVREISKMYEECKRGKAKDVLNYYQNKPPKGEIILILEPFIDLDPLSLEEMVKMLQELHGLSLKEAIKMAAKLKNTPKRDVYKLFHSNDL